MLRQKYDDIFISYRRDGGSAIAPLLSAQLEDVNFKVFLDTEAIGSGEFLDRIFKSIGNPPFVNDTSK